MADARRLVPAGLVVVLVALAASGCEPLDQNELRREVESLHSLAAEGATLADQVNEQRTKRTFARVHARELGDSAEHSAERLTDADPADGLEAQTEDAIALADQISSAIGSVEVAPDDPVAAGKAAEQLRSLAARATALGDEL